MRNIACSNRLIIIIKHFNPLCDQNYWIINLFHFGHNLHFRIKHWYWQKTKKFPNTYRYYWYSWTANFLCYLHKFLLSLWRKLSLQTTELLLNLPGNWRTHALTNAHLEAQEPPAHCRLSSASFDCSSLPNLSFSVYLERLTQLCPSISF